MSIWLNILSRWSSNGYRLCTYITFTYHLCECSSMVRMSHWSSGYWLNPVETEGQFLGGVSQMNVCDCLFKMYSGPECDCSTSQDISEFSNTLSLKWSHIIAFPGNKAPAFASMTSLRAKGAKNTPTAKPPKKTTKAVSRKEKLPAR